MPNAATEEREEITPGSNERPQAPEPLSVDLSPPDDDDEPSPKGGDDETRKGRRARLREVREALETERTARTKLENELAEMRGRIAALSSRPAEVRQPTAEADPYDSQIEGIEAQQAAIVAALRAEGTTEARAAELTKQYRKLDKDRRRLEYRQMQQEGGAESPRSRVEEDNEALQSEYPEVFNDPIRLQEAKTEMIRLAVKDKLPINIHTARRAAQAIRDKYNRKPPAPSEADKARLGGESGRAGAAGGTGNGRFTPDRRQLAAARAYTQHLEGLTDEQRVKIWAEKVGKPNKLI